MRSILLVFAALVAVATSKIQGDFAVRSIKTLTGDCDGCAMDVLGNFEIKLCGNNGCCNTGKLNDLLANDWEEGEVNEFGGDEIGECNYFNLGKLDYNTFLTLYHSGLNGGTLDWIEVKSTSNNRIKCDYGKELDNSDYSSITDCYEV